MEEFDWKRGREEWGGKYREEEAWLVGIRQTGETKKWYGKQKTHGTYMYYPWAWTKEGTILEGLGAGQRGDRGGKLGKL